MGALWAIVGGLCFHHARDGLDKEDWLDVTLYTACGIVCLVSSIAEFVG